MTEVEPRFKQSQPPPARRGYNSTLPASTKPINPISKQRTEELKDYDAAKVLVVERSKGRCELGGYGRHHDRCNGRATDFHHVIPRSLAFGEVLHSMPNVIHLSRVCHDMLEGDPLRNKKLAARVHGPKQS